SFEAHQLRHGEPDLSRELFGMFPDLADDSANHSEHLVSKFDVLSRSWHVFQFSHLEIDTGAPAQCLCAQSPTAINLGHHGPASVSECLWNRPTLSIDPCPKLVQR